MLVNQDAIRHRLTALIPFSLALLWALAQSASALQPAPPAIASAPARAESSANLAGPAPPQLQTAETTSPHAPPHIAHLVLRGPIGPAAADYITRAHAEALAAGAVAIVLELDTPGGLVSTTRDLVQLFLQSEIPVITWVGPAGARAASAGTYLLYASHVATMAPSTTVGAATPVALNGATVAAPAPNDPSSAATLVVEKLQLSAAVNEKLSSAAKPASELGAQEKKAINDAVAWIKTLAQRNGRNAEWAELAVREAATLTASEAAAMDVVDLIAASVGEVVNSIDGRLVTTATGEQSLSTADLPLRSYAPDWRNRLLAIITNPQIAYILLLVGIYGLLLEGYSPGALLPGTVGVIALVVALYALQLLPISYAGLALIAIGALLMFAEALAPSFGILGGGGVVALAIGSVLLMDTELPGFQISRGLIVGTVLSSGLATFGLMYVAGRTLRQSRPDVRTQLVGAIGTVASAPGEGLQVLVWGERWQADSEATLRTGQRVVVVAQLGLRLRVVPELLSESAPESEPARRDGKR